MLFKALSAAMCASAAAMGQCPIEWLTPEPFPGASNTVTSAAFWDPDGPGPRSPIVVITGVFTFLGTVRANGVAQWDPTSGAWAAMPDLENAAQALVWNGQLLVCGSFPGGIARWTGSAWTTIGPANSAVRRMTVAPGGDLLVAGDFSRIGDVPANCIARWNGAAWSPLGTGLDARAWSVAVDSNGDVYAGGEFATAGGSPAPFVARWNGAAWSPLGSGPAGRVYALQAWPAGGILVGGQFTTAGGGRALRVARWNGAWAPLGDGVSDSVSGFQILPDSSVLAMGAFTTAGGQPARGIARWDGASWSTFAGGVAGSASCALPLPDAAGDWHGRLLVGGSFPSAGDAAAQNLAHWDGAWSALGSAPNNVIFSLLAAPQGLVAGGYLTSAGGRPASCVALRRHDGWAALGRGFDSTVLTLARLPNGDLVAGGSFVRADGAPALHVARWDGSRWRPLGSLGTEPSCSAVLPNGDLVMGGIFTSTGDGPASRIARWDGAAWRPLGPGLNLSVYALAVLHDGSLVAGGDFTASGATPLSRIARWDGASWTPLGSGCDNTVAALSVLDSGDLIAGGAFLQAGGAPAARIARWDGARWSPLGAGVGDAPAARPISALLALPGGRLVAAGAFTSAGAQPASRIALWDGFQWLPLGRGLDDQGLTLALDENGDLAVGGRFVTADLQLAPYLTRLRGLAPPADYTGDGAIDAADYDAFVECFERDGPGRSADFNHDGFVDFFDYDDFVNAFESGC